jgi:hypothetical protein
MISTWVVGNEAPVEALGRKLTMAPFDLTVVVLSTGVGPFDDVATFLHSLSKAKQMQPLTVKEMRDKGMDKVQLRHALHMEKLVYRLDKRLYCFINKAKVTCVTSTGYQSRSRGLSTVVLATLHLTLNDKRQNMKDMTVGVVHVQGAMSEGNIPELVEWIVTSRMAILTGYFGNNQKQWSQIAHDAYAILDEPFVQWMKVPVDQITHNGYAGRPAFHLDKEEMATVAHPSPFMFFGYYNTAVAAAATPIPEDWVLGRDLFQELIGPLDMPAWEHNDDGSTEAQFLGKIKMKAIDFGRWCPGVIQTCVWIGTSQQGRGAGKRYWAKCDSWKSKEGEYWQNPYSREAQWT